MWVHVRWGFFTSFHANQVRRGAVDRATTVAGGLRTTTQLHSVAGVGGYLVSFVYGLKLPIWADQCALLGTQDGTRSVILYDSLS